MIIFFSEMSTTPQKNKANQRVKSMSCINVSRSNLDCISRLNVVFDKIRRKSRSASTR